MNDDEWLHKLREYFFSPKLEEVKVHEAIDLKYDYIPKRLFKYRQYGEYALENLKNNTLWCDSASGFNDPYDTSIHFEYSQATLDKQLIKSIEEQGASGVYQFLSKNEIEMLKNTDKPTKILAEITEQKTDGRIPADKMYAFLQGNTLQESEEMNLEFNRALKLGYKMCSLSQRNDSMLMWSHYSGEHTGFVMEYDFSDLPNENILTRMLWPMIYDNQLFDASAFFEEGLNGGMSNNMLAIIASIHKAKDWSYEREWRLIIPQGPNEPSLNYPGPKVKAIYVGALTPENDEHDLIEIGKSKNIPVYKMHLSQREFKMSPKVLYEP
ncbi:MAG: hypothetical protein ACI88H_001920 [Cocleimonas sp.]|jgi:hypothetical protein